MTIEKQARILVTRQRQRSNHRQSILLSRAAAELGVVSNIINSSLPASSFVVTTSIVPDYN